MPAARWTASPKAETAQILRSRREATAKSGKRNPQKPESTKMRGFVDCADLTK